MIARCLLIPLHWSSEDLIIENTEFQQIFGTVLRHRLQGNEDHTVKRYGTMFLVTNLQAASARGKWCGVENTDHIPVPFIGLTSYLQWRSKKDLRPLQVTCY